MEVVEEGQNQHEIPPKRINYQEITVKEEEVDRISALPDCLLLEILSRLPSTKEAIKTGTLSKRWKHVWTWLPSLLFTICGFKHPMSDFVSSVDKTLTQCRQLKLKKFELRTRYDIQFESHLNNWIHYAISCHVEELNLDVFTLGSTVKLLSDQKFFTASCFVDLKLRSCLFNPAGAISWKNLKRLSISCGILDEDLIENILLGSPLLEILALNYCSGYKQLNITSKSVKHLIFLSYMAPEDKYDASVIEINAPHILSLSIQGALWLWKLLLVDVSSLVEAELDYIRCGYREITREKTDEEMLKSLILILHHAEVLHIGESCHEVLNRLVAKGFSCTSNMRFPGVTYDYHDSDSVESEDCDSVENEDCDSVENEDCDSVESEDCDSGESEDSNSGESEDCDSGESEDM